jgi:epoxyqueuosine reductase
MKEVIRQFALGLGVDDVGFAAVSDYNSPRSPKIETICPGAQTIIVLAFKELSSCESPNMQVAMNGRLDVMEFSRSCNYKLARFLEKEYGAKAMTVGVSYPLDMSLETQGSIGDVSLRHAAVAAGLGSFGRHNLIIHPLYGSRVIFTAVLCNLDLASDPKCKEDLCTNCGLCVGECPVGALDQEGKTDVSKCLKNSQPYGLGATIQFWSRFTGSSLAEQKSMLKGERFWRMYQAGFIGFQYYCFKCFASCPLGKKI